MPHTLLLADDSLAIQRVVELTFANEDVRVVTVGDGQQAMDRLSAERPDIVLADIAMPLADGYAVAEFVRASPATRDVPVLLLAGAFDIVEESRVSASGARGVLVKPFEPHVVINRVRELLGLKTGAEPAAAPVEPPRIAPPAEPPRPPRMLADPPFWRPPSEGAPAAAPAAAPEPAAAVEPTPEAPSPSTPPAAATAPAAPIALDETTMAALVERVAARVVEEMDARLRDTVTARVLDVSERLVRDEIARIHDAARDAE